MKKTLLKEKIIVYPYGYEFAPILRGLLNDGMPKDSIRLVSPTAWGLCGKDAGEAFGQPKLDIAIKSDVIEELENCSVFVAADYEQVDDENTNEKIDRAIDEYKIQAQEKGLEVLDLREMKGISAEEVEAKSRIPADEREYYLPVPVIIVSGLAEHTCKLDVQVALGKALGNMGYRVCQIGSRDYCRILGMHDFPEFMTAAMPEDQKIDLFRKYLYMLCQEESPDLFIIGIPGAAIPYNAEITNQYGVMNFLVGMAVRGDFTIVCTHMDGIEVNQLDQLYTHRFGNGIGCFAMANTQIYYNRQDMLYGYQLRSMDFKEIPEAIRTQPIKSGIPFYNIFEPQDIERIARQITGELSEDEYFAI